MIASLVRSGALLTLVLASTAQADDEPLPQGSQPEYGVMPMASQGSNRRLERRLSRQERPKQDRRYSGPTAVLGLQGGVPLFVGNAVDRSVIRPGGSFTLLAGADLGYFVPEIEFGYLAVPIDPVALPREPLQRIHLGFGTRLQVPNRSPVLPYLGFGFAAQWWKFDTLGGCVLVACSTGSRFRFAPGLSFRAGTSISFARSAAIDIGVRYILSFEGDTVFTQNTHIIEPSIGFRFWL